MIFRTIALTVISVFMIGRVAMAQEQTPSTPQQEANASTETGARLRKMRRQRLELSRTLQLSDDQQQMRKAIRQRHFEATKVQREQLFQLREKRRVGTLTDEDRNAARQLRLDLRKSMANMRTESLNVLTSEQRERMKSLREQHKQRRHAGRQRFNELRRNRQLEKP